jgi:hypothetical protein
MAAFVEHYAHVEITDQNENTLLMICTRLGIASPDFPRYCRLALIPHTPRMMMKKRAFGWRVTTSTTTFATTLTLVLVVTRHPKARFFTAVYVFRHKL